MAQEKTLSELLEEVASKETWFEADINFLIENQEHLSEATLARLGVIPYPEKKSKSKKEE